MSITPLSAELLQHTGWLHALARNLLKDAHLAEDVVQDAWLAALRSGSAPPGGPRRRAWLAQVTRQLALSRRREEGRRRRREEETARRDSLPSTDEAVERIATQRLLTEAVLALDEADRDVVVLRYFEGEPPRRIAAHLNTTPAAVRSRLSRALGKLRVRLDAEYGGDGRGWALALLPLARIAPAPAVEPATPGSGVLVPDTLEAASLGFGTAALGAVACMLLLGGLGWWGLGGDRGTQNTEPQELAWSAQRSAAVDSGPAEVETAETNAKRQPEEAGIERVAVRAETVLEPGDEPVAASRPQVVAHARLIDGSGRPLAGVPLRAPDIEGIPQALSGADGRVRLALDWPFRLTHGNDHWVVVDVLHAEWTHTRHQQSIEGPMEVEFGEITLKPGAEIRGRVFDADGNPVERAFVAALLEVAGASQEVEDMRRVFGYKLPWAGGSRAFTDEHGSFRIQGVAVGSRAVCVRYSGCYVAISDPVTLRRGEVSVIEDVILERLGQEHLIRGHVLDAAGQPMAGERLQLYPNRSPRNVDAISYGGTDASGAFAIPALEGDYTVAVGEHGALVRHDVPAGAQGVELRFPKEERFEMRIRNTRGEVVADARIFLEAEGGSWAYGEAFDAEAGWYRATAMAMPFHISVHSSGHRVGKVGPFTPGEVPARVEIELELAAAIRGRVTRSGLPVSGAEVHAHVSPKKRSGGEIVYFIDNDLYSSLDAGYEVRGRSAKTNDDGTFELFLREEDRYVLHAELEGQARAESGWLEVGFDEPLDEPLEGIELRIPQSAVLEGRVLTADGVSPAGTIVAATRGRGHAHYVLAGDDGSFRFEGLTAGDWQVARAKPDDQQWLRTERYWPDYEMKELPEADVTLRAGDVAQYDLDFRDEVPCRVEGSLSLGGEPAAGWQVGLWCGRSSPHAELDPLGRFAVSAPKSGEATLNFSRGSYFTDRESLSAAISTVAGAQSWSLDLPTGTLELFDLPAGEVPKDLEDYMPEYALVWKAGELFWSMTFEARGKGALHRVRPPLGTVTLRRQGPDRQGYDPSSWPIVETFTIAAGGTTTFRHPPESRSGD